jgi:hypothetical protein
VPFTVVLSSPTTSTTLPSTARGGSPVVTLEPTGGHGEIPGDASDPGDFYGIVVALAVIVVVVVAVRLIFRSGGRSRRRG